MKHWRVWLGLLISAASILLVARQVDLAEVAEHVARAQLPMLAVLVASVPATIWMKSARWRLFFDPQDRVSTAGLFSAMFIGYMVIAVVPFRAGELVRALLVAQGSQITWSRVLATIVVEKVLDVLAVAVMLLVLGRIVPLPDLILWAAQAGGMLIAASVLGLIGLALAERRLVHLLERLEARIPPLARLKLGGLLVSFNQGLGFARSGAAVGRVAAWTVAIWVVAGVTIWASLEGMGMPSSPAAVVLVLSLTNLGMVVPSGPSYIGTYHFAVVESLRVFGIESSQALGTAVVLHGLTFGTILVGGLLFLWRGQYSLSRLLASARQSSHASSTEPAQSAVL